MILTTNNKDKNYQKTFFKATNKILQSMNQCQKKEQKLRIKITLSKSLSFCKMFKK